MILLNPTSNFLAAEILQGQTKCPPWVCAVKRRRFPVGVSPTRQPLQPEATGGAMEVTKWLKTSDSVSRIGGKGPQFKTNAASREGPGDWATYQLRKVFRNCRWRYTRKR